jgi:hypothetical protein
MSTELDNVLDRILSSKEMRKKFGRTYDIRRSGKDELVYINVDLFVRELANNPGNISDPNKVPEDIVPTYLSLVKSFEKYESRKRKRTRRF